MPRNHIFCSLIFDVGFDSFFDYSSNCYMNIVLLMCMIIRRDLIFLFLYLIHFTIFSVLFFFQYQLSSFIFLDNFWCYFIVQWWPVPQLKCSFFGTLCLFWQLNDFNLFLGTDRLGFQLKISISCKFTQDCNCWMSICRIILTALMSLFSASDPSFFLQWPSVC